MATESTATAAIAAELVPAHKIEDAPAPSTSSDKVESMDVDNEAKKLLGLGQKHLVMGDIPAAVNAFQEAASLLGKKYGETANECGEAFFFYGKSLLELARMENGVLGNALEGVRVEEEKTEDESVAENNDNIDEEAREELREQVYDAMGENEAAKKTESKSLAKPETDLEQKRELEKDGREDMDISEPTEKLTVELTPHQLTETSEESKGTAGPEGRDEAEVTTRNPEQKAPDTEEGKPVFGTDIQKEECSERGQEEQEELIVSTKEKPKENSKEQPIVTLEKQGTAAEMEVEAEPVELTVTPMDVGGDEPEGQVAASENEPRKALQEQLVGQEELSFEESLVVTTEATEALAPQSGSEVSEKPEQEATVLPQEGPVSGQAVGDETPVEAQTSAETLTETKGDLGLEDKVGAELVPSQEEIELPVEESEAAGDGVETKVAQRATEKAPEDKVKIAANEETQEREEQMKEGEETEGSEEEDKENDKAEETPNESILENKSLQESEEEDIGNLELAWDMLDLAKIIFKRQETKEAQLYAAQAHLKLGEVSVESENYIQAVEEFQACLALQEQYLEAHDRLLAETHYQLGLAYGYNSQYDEAVAQFSRSVEVIEKRMAVLNEQMKEAEGSSTEYEKEIEELKELLPEIREKIEDAKESQRSGNVAELALKATLVESSTSGFTPSRGGSSVSMIASRRTTDGASSSNCVTDISHLVRKKRKPEEESPRKDDAKKAKQEPEVNGGSGDAVPSGNEVSGSMEEEAEKQADSRATVDGAVEAGAAVETTAC
ncbi:nuclear autoantigenic sperm protein isoform X1 [Fukomys damarensis]|uniref:nuclear autoantigenic sperm protein isoform X1 n=1 Tax=Fukomys damarensis TaxID=885580 RepID=UPI00053F2D92|nr:nuclear autoantigenic sperm protein isoform X1 [Fukomys damarensis]XP_010608481.1 nuclear autoantigenic sperm protein isoform X1 [Fukomys damarensis]XP_010608482.1 nuclear autoantigenic sperm protein isoform X1 [Fukomys damarensis]XP_010608484.1 nuclear autoantigenic sperm protein isoform X1 [Fukomys damarensis]